MTDHAVVSASEWEAARIALLAKEKDLTRLRDELSAARRALPWHRVEKDYVFEGENGPQTLSDLFAGNSQLIVQHFMFHPDWNEGCKSCSFWADNFQPAPVHLAHRDVSFVAISRAPYAKLVAYKTRMGWTFPWVSSGGNSFNYDFGVSFTPDELRAGTQVYNYRERGFNGEDAHGVSVFAKGNGGAIFHTYSTFGRGVDPLNGTYQLLDLVPKGRDEDGFDFPMTWLRRHDQYEEE